MQQPLSLGARSNLCTGYSEPPPFRLRPCGHPYSIDGIERPREFHRAVERDLMVTAFRLIGGRICPCCPASELSDCVCPALTVVNSIDKAETSFFLAKLAALFGPRIPIWLYWPRSPRHHDQPWCIG